MSASEIIEVIESSGGRLVLDVAKGIIRYDIGTAPERVARAIKRTRNEVARLIFARQFLRLWEPRKGDRIQ